MTEDDYPPRPSWYDENCVACLDIYGPPDEPSTDCEDICMDECIGACGVL